MTIKISNMEEFRLVRFNGGNLQHRKGTGTSEACKNSKNPILLMKRMVMTTTMSNYAQS